jgi:NitT/TauT family transport system substrate-binding protein
MAQLTPVGKLAIFLLVAGAVFGGYRYFSGQGKNGSGAFSTVNSIESSEQGILGRPLRVGIVTWPGYAGGLVANGGFKSNKKCIYWNNHKLLVEFLLMEDVDARGKAFARGGADGVDIVWSTVDFWANELPGFIKNGVKAKAVMQVDWSRGGDAIVADKSIQKIEDLRGKKISLALFTPSHWLLEYSLQNSSLDESEQEKIVKSLVGKNASPDARLDFVAGKVDAAVVWEPDVAEALAKRPNSHILVSTKTAANLISDVMVAREDFIQKNPNVIKAFVAGWFEGTAEANRSPNKAVQVLMENEPLYKELGEEATREQLSAVRWADLADNTKMFGLDGSEPLFDRIFAQAGESWVRRGYIPTTTSAASAKDTTFLKALYDAVPKDVRPVTRQEEFKFPPKAPEVKKQAKPLFTRPVNIYFGTGQVALDANAKSVLDGVALTAQTYSNAYIRVEGNTDSVGDPNANIALSQRRAQAVVDYLVARYKFSPGRFIAKGNGASKPLGPNTTAEGKSKNRRTDIVVLEK